MKKVINSFDLIKSNAKLMEETILKINEEMRNIQKQSDDYNFDCDGYYEDEHGAFDYSEDDGDVWD